MSGSPNRNRELGSTGESLIGSPSLLSESGLLSLCACVCAAPSLHHPFAQLPASFFLCISSFCAALPVLVSGPLVRFAFLNGVSLPLSILPIYSRALGIRGRQRVTGRRSSHLDLDNNLRYSTPSQQHCHHFGRYHFSSLASTAHLFETAAQPHVGIPVRFTTASASTHLLEAPSHSAAPATASARCQILHVVHRDTVADSLQSTDSQISSFRQTSIQNIAIPSQAQSLQSRLSPASFQFCERSELLIL